MSIDSPLAVVELTKEKKMARWCTEAFNYFGLITCLAIERNIYDALTHIDVCIYIEAYS